MGYKPKPPRRFSTAWAKLVNAVASEGKTIMIDASILNSDNPKKEACRIRSEFYQFRTSLTKFAQGEMEEQLAILSDSIIVRIVGNIVIFSPRDNEPLSMEIEKQIAGG